MAFIFLMITLAIFTPIATPLGHRGLECYMERHPIDEMPFWRHTCQKPQEWMHVTRTENCVKIVHSGVVERGCDRDFFCPRFHIRNRCIKGLLGAGSEICCCSTPKCNSVSTPSISMLPYAVALSLLYHRFTWA
uniref:Activin_recp domain-containing protein n=1 Tax=Panagrellus redivivus TaxID=6233 RepID=A0A7E4UL75_PANRE